MKRPSKTLKMAALCALIGVGGAYGLPVVSDVSVRQREASRLVEVTYRLTGEKAIVTVDIQTNGVSIGAANFANVGGDVNKELSPSDSAVRTITWQPKDSWPNRVVEGQSLQAVVIAHTHDSPPDYMAVDLVMKDTIRYYDSADAVPGGVTNDIYKTEKMLFRRISAAGVEWRMGSPSEGIAAEIGRKADETPHLVTLSRDYYMAVYETTYRQFNLIGNGNYGTEDDWKMPFSPIYGSCRGTAWPEGGHANVGNSSLAKKFRNKACGFMFDLPTEAQWEFACRGGSGAAFCNGGNLTSKDAETDENADRYAVYKANSQKNANGKAMAAEVGTKEPNAWGLYDMHGNCNEWCLDWYAEDTSAFASLDPKGPTKEEAEALGAGLYRVYRGGACSSRPADLRSAYRNSRDQWADWGGVAIRFCCPIPMTAVD